MSCFSQCLTVTTPWYHLSIWTATYWVLTPNVKCKYLIESTQATLLYLVQTNVDTRHALSASNLPTFCLQEYTCTVHKSRLVRHSIIVDFFPRVLFTEDPDRKLDVFVPLKVYNAHGSASSEYWLAVSKRLYNTFDKSVASSKEAIGDHYVLCYQHGR